MSTQPPSAELVAEFEKNVDAAATDLLERFDWIGLPDTCQREDLLVELSDAISKVFKEWL